MIIISGITCDEELSFDPHIIAVDGNMISYTVLSSVFRRGILRIIYFVTTASPLLYQQCCRNNNIQMLMSFRRRRGNFRENGDFVFGVYKCRNCNDKIPGINMTIGNFTSKYTITITISYLHV